MPQPRTTVFVTHAAHNEFALSRGGSRHGPDGYLPDLRAINGTQSGGMMTKTPQTPAPFWLYYFNVEAVDGATARAKDGGGEILNGPMATV